MKHLLTLKELSSGEILEILALADKLKEERKRGENRPYLAGKTLGMIFQKASTRTRVSFEAGMYQLGGTVLFLSGRDLQLGRGEEICDTARVLSRYLDGIMIRTYAQREAEEFAKYGSIPIINGLTDYCHPCQVLADLMTVREIKGGFEGRKLCYIGDGNNMAHSLIVGGMKLNMRVAAACPLAYRPDKNILKWAKETGDFTLTEDPKEAARDADILVTDVWASMGAEEEAAQRREVFEGTYQINEGLMSAAKADAMVLHCLPAHRGEEITADIFEAHAKEIFEEAENRLYVQKAVMVKLMGGERT